MTVRDSSSSVTKPGLEIELTAAGLLPPLPAAFLDGRALELLQPLRFLLPGELPEAGPSGFDRGPIAAALGAWNREIGHPRAAEQADLLADPETLVVVTGQQPGLLGGPLYTLSKAIAAARWVGAINAHGGKAVAVFWSATEDHDFAEVAAVGYPTREGLVEHSLGEDEEPLKPVGLRSLGTAIGPLIEGLGQWAAGAEDASWRSRLTDIYRPERSFGEAFGELMIELLGDGSPLLLDALDPNVKALQRPILERLVTQREEVDSALVERQQAIVAAGFKPQVRHRAGASPLFLIDDGARRRIEWVAADFRLRGGGDEARPIGELERILSDDPARVGPGVLARPLVQDALLGTSLQLLGPGELSYIPQVAALYPLLGVAPPAVALRPQIVVLSRRQVERLWAVGEETGLQPLDLVRRQLDLSRFVARSAGADPVTPVKREVEQALEGLRTVATEAGLESPWAKTRDNVLRSLERLGSKLDAATARQNETVRRRLEELRETARPGGGLQERTVSTAWFVARYGRAFAAAVAEQMSLDGSRLRVVVPDHDRRGER